MGLFDKLKPKYKSSNADVRIEAINELNDDKILFEMCLNDDVKNVRLSAFRKISSHRYWPLIVVQSNDDDIKKEAFDKITDSEDLYIIVTQSKDRNIRKNAINKISDLNTLLKLKSEINDYLRVNIENRVEELSIEEIDKITDENTLKSIVINESNNLNVRLAAIKKITNDRILEIIYFKVSNFAIEKECLNRISDDEKLISVINHKYHIDFLRIVFNKLQPKSVIKLLKSFNFTIYDDDDVQEVFKDQLDKITDKNALNGIARNAANSTIREMAVEKVTDKKTLISIAKNNDEETHVREKAIEKITDNNVLKDIYYNADYFGRELVIKNITDQDFLYDHYKASHSLERRDIIKKITDEAILSEIIKDCKDWAIASHIALKSKNESTLRYILDKEYFCIDTYYTEPNENAAERLKELGYE